MSRWHVATTTQFVRELKRCDKPVQARLIAYLAKVAELDDPRARGRALTGEHAGLWRYRVGDYRIVVKIIDAQITVLTLHVAHRSVVY